MYLNKIEKEQFIDYIRDILQTEQFQETKDYCQHGDTSTYTHCIMVSCFSYWLALRLPRKYDIRSVVRGALLHDFYLYDWHIPDKSHRLHGFSHANAALLNANLYFDLNQTEKDIIKSHMWPLNLTKIPRNREAMLVCLVDKFCSLAETFHISLFQDEKENKSLHNRKPKLNLNFLQDI